MNKITWALIGSIVVIGILGYWAVVQKDQKNQKDRNIATFDECVAGGNKVQETYPQTCVTKDGRSFTGPISPDDRLVPPSATITPAY